MMRRDIIPLFPFMCLSVTKAHRPGQDSVESKSHFKHLFANQSVIWCTEALHQLKKRLCEIADFLKFLTILLWILTISNRSKWAKISREAHIHTTKHISKLKIAISQCLNLLAPLPWVFCSLSLHPKARAAISISTKLPPPMHLCLYATLYLTFGEKRVFPLYGDPLWYVYDGYLRNRDPFSSIW